ncbi:hemolysin expression modulator Hha [Pantoea agglomerans]|nr:hemolysin expression modulator Hha [Pantoea agglomerans]NEG98810.1 hemolysin expression modulator Hha [Pantoea agglomerans]NEH05206.1 hemolysin expression modulator Hha [Pantoea agglomerans]NEH16195.1 hemolysin expression modulator Hha [Pantoea agglomerans]
MTKTEWLMKLRRLNNIESLEKVIEKNSYKLNDAALAIFWGAADHRLAELMTNHLYDRVPRDIWHLIR